MTNIAYLLYMKPLLYKIGIILSQLGNKLQKQSQSNHPLNIHSHVKQTMDYITFYLHNLNATLDKHRQSASKNWESEDIESIYCAVHHLLYSKTDDVDSGRELVFTEELCKLEWLCEGMLNIPDVHRMSKETYNDSNFDKISGNR